MYKSDVAKKGDGWEYVYRKGGCGLIERGRHPEVQKGKCGDVSERQGKQR